MKTKALFILGSIWIVQKGVALYGFSVDIVANPQEVLSMDISCYDMVILDIRMPQIDGFQLYETIKDKIRAKKTKVCFFTAFTGYQEMYNQKFPKWNGCCFMTKPMSTKILAERLHELLSKEDVS